MVYQLHEMINHSILNEAGIQRSRLMWNGWDWLKPEPILISRTSKIAYIHA